MRCEDGWFGYKCQYLLVQYRATANQTSKDITESLHDDNEATCIETGTQLIHLDLNDIFYNPWIRLFTQRPDLLYSLKISFMDRNSQAVVAASKEKCIVRDNVVDIHIAVNNFINYIILEGEVIQQLCSLWIIVGQNVMPKQNVYHSNSNISRIVTHLPQYPQAIDGIKRCNESDTGHAGKYWEIILNQSFIIKQYDFYINDVSGKSGAITYIKADSTYNLETAPNAITNGRGICKP
uniref:Uncharacterized protein n=1 Tax=Biomphalaria glabrata TaxID=6526 RepID=A0A2C9KQC5_BIOGL